MRHSFLLGPQLRWPGNVGWELRREFYDWCCANLGGGSYHFVVHDDRDAVLVVMRFGEFMKKVDHIDPVS